MNRFIKTTLVAASIALVSACNTSPTGRTQVLLYNDAQLDEMGAQTFSSMKSEATISQKATTNALVQCIADELLAHVDDSVFAGEWEVVVFDEPQVNAFALPGGKIGVYTGLLDVAVNQHQIAAVVGHEIGHVIAKHGNQRMSKSDLIGMGQQLLSSAVSASETAQNNKFVQAFAAPAISFTGTAVNLYYSRDHETEADEIGIDLMAKAGFDPSESISLWENMAAVGGSKPPEFLSTHPSESTRIKNLTAKLPSANTYYSDAEKATCE
ncbi:MAG: M48 family metallopeptidase [Glaciecola sp.]